MRFGSAAIAGGLIVVTNAVAPRLKIALEAGLVGLRTRHGDADDRHGLAFLDRKVTMRSK